MRKVILLLVIACFSSHSVELEGELTQGSLIRGKTTPNSQVWLNDKPIKVSEEGIFVFGFGRDATVNHKLTWQNIEGHLEHQSITLAVRQYDIQEIEGLPAKMVTPPKEVLERIRSDNLQVAKARNRVDDRVDFSETFVWPAAGPISGVYGSQRVLNGVKKRPHFGVDVAAPTGTPIYAPASGIVSLWVADMYYSGGTMIIDHGHGVSSTFLHMSKGVVEVGSRVEQGQLVGEIGATGRVTGAHLDWRMNWYKERLDPALLVPKR
jgi:murein DD-endopeptidase MepM/ murein hydrolase activator NlpD